VVDDSNNGKVAIEFLQLLHADVVLIVVGEKGVSTC
jgi:hypothetical protein